MTNVEMVIERQTADASGTVLMKALVTIDGTQAEYVRIPHADTSRYRVPPDLDVEAVVMSRRSCRRSKSSCRDVTPSRRRSSRHLRSLAPRGWMQVWRTSSVARGQGKNHEHARR